MAERRTPKIHYSSPRLDIEERKVKRNGRRVEQQIVLPQLRAHADLIDPIGFERFMRDVAGGRDFDVMLEAKAKDLAVSEAARAAGRTRFRHGGGAAEAESDYGLGVVSDPQRDRNGNTLTSHVFTLSITSESTHEAPPWRGLK